MNTNINRQDIEHTDESVWHRVHHIPNKGTRRLPGLLLMLGLAKSLCASDALPELEITEIQEGIYLHKSYQQTEEYGLASSNGLVVVDGESAFIVDTPWSEPDVKKLVNWIEAQGLKPVGSLSTHSHEDRTAGIAWLNSQAIPTYASGRTNDILRDQGKALATQAFDAEQLSLADGLIEAFYPGPGHTVDNLVVWLPAANILYGGCFIRSIKSNGLGYTGEAFIDQWPSSVDVVLAKYPSAQRVIPGHGKEGDTTLLFHTKTLALSAQKALN